MQITVVPSESSCHLDEVLEHSEKVGPGVGLAYIYLTYIYVYYIIMVFKKLAVATSLAWSKQIVARVTFTCAMDLV